MSRSNNDGWRLGIATSFYVGPDVDLKDLRATIVRPINTRSNVLAHHCGIKYFVYSRGSIANDLPWREEVDVTEGAMAEEGVDYALIRVSIKYRIS